MWNQHPSALISGKSGVAVVVAFALSTVACSAPLRPLCPLWWKGFADAVAVGFC